MSAPISDRTDSRLRSSSSSRLSDAFAGLSATGRPLRSLFMAMFALGSLSALAVFPGTASAQTPTLAEVSTCVAVSDITGGKRYTNNCNQDVILQGADSSGGGTCFSKTYNLKKGDSGTDKYHDVLTTQGSDDDDGHLPLQLCMVYEDKDHQYESGRKECHTLSAGFPNNNTFADCGQGSRNYIASPGALPTGTITTSAPSISLNEGSGTFGVTVSLSAAPASEVRLTISSDNSDVTATPSSLTFSTSNWNTGQDVTFRAVDDDDLTDDSATITIAPTTWTTGNQADGRRGSGLYVPNRTLTATVTDDDQRINVDGNDTVELGEPNTNKPRTHSFNVTLGKNPGASGANVTVATSDVGAVTISSSSLSLTGGTGNTSNWNTGVAVTVTAVDDPDGTAESVTITFSTATAANVTKTVTVSDNDGSIVTTPSSVTAIEGGTAGTFSVKLGAPPASSATISVVSGATNAATVSPATLTFTPSNAATPQTVTVTGAQDANGTDASATITLSATSGYTASQQTVSVDVEDDDGEIELSASSVTVTEGGNDTFTVKLGAPPISNITLQVTSGDSSVMTVSPSTLTFGASNYGTPQTVTVTGTEDTDGTDDSGTVTLSVSGGGYRADNETVSITVEDNDGAIELSEDSGDDSDDSKIILDDESDTDTFTVKLEAPPASSATLSVTSDDTSVATVSPATLTFSSSNYNTAQTVTVAAVEDADGTDDTGGGVTVSVTGGYRADNATASITVEDDDGEIIVSAAAVSAAEGDADGETFDVTLGAPPAVSTTVTVTNGNTGVVTVSPATLTFTAANYDEAQEVTVVAEDDFNYKNESADITLGNDENDTSYRADPATVTKSVSVVDDDEEPSGTVMVRSPTTTLVEGGGGSVWGVSLVADDEDDPIIFEATVSLTFTGVTDADDDAITITPTTLTFLPNSPNKEQLVTIAAKEDDDYADQSVRVKLTAAGKEENGGAVDAPVKEVEVLVKDDDTPPTGSIVLDDAGPLTLTEGTQGAFTVKLGGTVPRFDVNVELRSSDPGAVSVFPTRMTFDSSNSTRAQTARVTAVSDSNYANESATIFISVVAGGGITATGVPKLIEVVDDDKAAGVMLSEERLSLGENQSTTVEFRLNQESGYPVNVSLTTSNPDIVAEPSAFVVEPSQWNTPRPISVYVLEDSNRHDDSGILTFTATTGIVGSAFERATHELPIKMTEASLPVEEGGEPPPAPTLTVQSHALAIPPPSARDQATLRIWCRHGLPCTVSFECSAQQDGTFLSGRMSESIPSMGTVSLSAEEIAEIIGGSWEGKGRLGCALLSEGDLLAQVWTRSGDGVLINNSAALASVENRVDIHDIPSPESADLSNIRIRCPTEVEGDCQAVHLKCHDNEGYSYQGFLGTIERGATMHLQTSDLSEIIDHRWSGSELFCQVRASRAFTVQVLTRTGGGGALVNNSARGGV